MSVHQHHRLGMKALLIHEELAANSQAGRAVRQLAEELEERQVEVLLAQSAEDAIVLIHSDPMLQCVLLDWELALDDSHAIANRVLDAVRERSEGVPIFLLADRSSAATIPLEAMQKSDDFIWLLEDTTRFISGRIVAAIQRYREAVLPPMFGALVRFSQVYEYSWHTPGHTGGTAFLKSTVGRAFFDFFGENLFRSDLSISVGELGSLLDHSGPIGASEVYAARVFGAHRTYHVTNGSSTSNRVILMASVTRDQVTLCDRNCHKSVEHAMTMSGAIPTYLIPSRNHYGLIGPIPPQRLTPEAISSAVANNPLLREGLDPTPMHAIITNSTYDGLCYNVTRVEALLGQSVDRLHFDEAWFGYARFNPIYRERFAMHGEPADYAADRPTVFATQSTHKLLAALSQASMIHVRDGRRPIEHARFNEAFMMHASTSPNYAIIASNDVSAAMMDGPSGKALTGDSIREAIAFRRMLARLNSEFQTKGEWFFNVWQPDTVTHPKSAQVLPFFAADEELLSTEPACWVLKPNAAWHGFGDIEDGYCMLDPIKVSIITPGILPGGGMSEQGIPAVVLTAYLDRQGIVVEKTTDFTILFLFSIGVTKGKWGTLVNTLLDFKRDYDANASLDSVLPALLAAHPQRYRGMGLRALCESMFQKMAELRTTDALSQAFSTLPEPRFSPVAAYEQLVRDNVEVLTLEQMAGRTVATGVVPYPPGIPLLMPGESAGAADGPILGYLRALEEYDRHFPGFTHDTHGVEVEDGLYRIRCIK
ncbi:Orn/Lys/Arg decarboxylase N-terminal domain-containing protein [Pseudomonas sp. 10B1]|uniref:Orn/Lys/Arg family decarboxylase n=2 Tax=unclassified Pseudomonas TaxID=196821 RepID=UPI002B3E113E|nr:Orn/Lys/Arg decarboxylase N-terminal domain-containing protein [Pseudomonas sp. AA4]MEB0088386.1 Orn/Lys/Arg decarboxylase N-terminal domain-containing protein [Pseudomonas sp. RTI1]MEB0124149.1 Orn/Lys/Arg decarboxylase N-terminal domain-containing protein [Pseudomonas sp. CCC1.2]MEB0152608.1 Orn/Lys/Arg decarboxylase N-terminal domain-containing protein [Pseudomonas sp. CCC4.3]MEB0181554.1 Orn/Lys/Arg decarboxylase N-terminal domain-containing protein [Pseudomonas sp. CCC3.2]MEB0212033.1 